MDLPARADWPPPFEALPEDRTTWRRRAVRDGLIISGWLATGFALTVVPSIAHSVGYDAYSYWSIDFSDLYGRAMSSNFALGAFRYAPPIAFLFGPLGALPWWLVLWLWEALMLALIAWLGGRWALVLLAMPPVALELYHGNVHLLIAAAIVLGLRYPAAWSFVLLTKVTPGVGLLWFVVRREWRSLAIALGVTALLVAASLIIDGPLWQQWMDKELLVSLRQSPDQPQIAIPLLVRLPVAAAIVAWGAWTDRRWTVPLAAALAMPVLWFSAFAVLAAIPAVARPELREQMTVARRATETNALPAPDPG